MHRSFDSASFAIQNRRTPRSFLRGRIRGKDRGGIRFRIRTPPRDGSVRFGIFDDLGLLRLSGITPNVHTAFPGATSHTAFENDVIGVEVIDSLDTFLHFGHRETPPPVEIQNADQQSVDLVGNRENGGEEAGGVLEVGVEGGVTEGGQLSWVATSKVKENDAEGPDIMEQGRIRAVVGYPPWHSGQ